MMARALRARGGGLAAAGVRACPAQSGRAPECVGRHRQALAARVEGALRSVLSGGVVAANGLGRANGPG